MKTIVVNHASDANQRLDKFIKKYFPGAALGLIYRALRTGKIKVNAKKTEQNYRLSEWDEITFFFSDEDIASWQKKETEHKKTQTKRQKLQVLYRDEYILVVHKPAGINVHPGDHKTEEVSLIEQVHDMLGKGYNSLTFRPSLVHRIDRDTSGCVVIALQKNALEGMLSLLQSHAIEKIYHTIVAGKMPKPRWTIEEKLIRIENAKQTAKVRVDNDHGQRAITHYKTLAEYEISGKALSLLECKIETGRTHQIRVHLSHSGCPIIGDTSYGNSTLNRHFRHEKNIHRQMLHAYSLAFVHPITKKNIRVVSPYFEDFASLLPKKYEA